MNRRIILERSVTVGCWRVVGQVAKSQRRTELVPVLMRADENDGTDARDLAEHLLFESRSRRVVANRLLRIATAYGLVEESSRDFVLTEAGKRAIHTGEVFVPEDGASGRAMIPPSLLLSLESSRGTSPRRITKLWRRMGRTRKSADTGRRRTGCERSSGRRSDPPPDTPQRFESIISRMRPRRSPPIDRFVCAGTSAMGDCNSLEPWKKGAKEDGSRPSWRCRICHRTESGAGCSNTRTS